jgi:hypothetical protein
MNWLNKMKWLNAPKTPTLGILRIAYELLVNCHRAVENRPLAGTSKPATPRWPIHISFLDPSKGFFNFFISAGAFY